MKPLLTIILALAVLAAPVSAQARLWCGPLSATAPKAGPKLIRKSQLHDGCHSRNAHMRGKPCH